MVDVFFSKSRSSLKTYPGSCRDSLLAAFQVLQPSWHPHKLTPYLHRSRTHTVRMPSHFHFRCLAISIEVWQAIY